MIAAVLCLSTAIIVTCSLVALGYLLDARQVRR